MTVSTTRCPDNALDRNFYTVFDWMVDPAGLGLKASSAELSVYAKIYSMSHHSAYGYYVTQDQLALDLYISRRSVQRALDSLCRSGLIGYNELYRTGREANGMKSPRSYFAIQEKINAAIEATTPVSASRGGQILDFDFGQSALIFSVLKTSMMHPYTIDVDTIRCGPRGDPTFRWRPQGCPRFLTCPARAAASRDRRMT